VESTVGITEEIIWRYVAQQGKEDAGQAQLEYGFEREADVSF